MMDNQKGPRLFDHRPEKKDQKENAQLDENNRVIVRVWYSKINEKKSNALKVIKKIKKNEEENANIGHCSAETPNNYVSTWPGEDETVTSLVKCYRSENHTLVDDELAESGLADLTICFYSLNIDAIDEAFEKIQEGNVGYVLMGETSVSEKGGQSCSSMVYFLLRAGGIDKLKSNKSSTMASAIITPNSLAEFLRYAKLKELEKHPETENFSRIEGEYMPEHKQAWRCVIS